ncbi:MAG: hypothetical protein HXS54_05390 [Theionarchaea archaeon]|nr:hypothetical protein [Theionarchaea archaeon]
MNSGNPGKRISGWVAVLPVIFILVVRFAQSYLVEKGKNDVADLIGVGVPFVLLIGIIVSLYVWGIFGTPPVDPPTAEKIQVIQALISECLEEKDLKREDIGKEELLCCIQDKLREKGIFNITYFHVKMYLEAIDKNDVEPIDGGSI